MNIKLDCGCVFGQPGYLCDAHVAQIMAAPELERYKVYDAIVAEARVRVQEEGRGKEGKR